MIAAMAGAALVAIVQPAEPATVAPAAAQEPASTAVKLEPVDTRITVAVTIDGAGPFRFVVDSGATRTVVSDRLATRLGLPSAGTVTLHSVGGESVVPAVRIAAMTLGGLPARPIVAPVLREADLGCAGILGIDALADKKVVIDLPRNTMSIERPDRSLRRAASGDEIVVVARRRYGQLVLADADVAGQRVYAVVDTGSMVTIGDLVLRDKLVRRKRAIPISTAITDVTGRAVPAQFAPVSRLRIGAWTVAGASIAFADAHAFERFGLRNKPAMLLGMDLLRAYARVSIDFGRRAVRLTRRREAGVEVRTH